MTERYGLTYEFGKRDCFTFVHRYYNDIGIPFNNREDFIDDWWEQDIDYFCPEYIKKWGFIPSTKKNLQPKDLLIFNVKCSVPNHCGVYIEQNMFAHHAHGRLSCVEDLYPFWTKFLVGAYSYEKNIS
jgi:cell wall-associated NlpC family hydrolase